MNALSNVIAPRPAGPSTTVSGSNKLGKDEFLKLLVAQLKNQDPSSPLKPEEFAAQLAQFTSVEQLTKLNDTVAAQAAANEVNKLLNQTVLSVTLLGRHIVAKGDQVSVPTGGGGTVRVNVGGTGGTGTLHLLDSAGNEVAQQSLGYLAAGAQQINLSSKLPAGDWHYRVTVADAAGKSAAANSYTSGAVTGVSFLNGKLLLNVGNAIVAMDDLVEIQPGP